MKKRWSQLGAVAFVLFTICLHTPLDAAKSAAKGDTPERKTIEARYKWNLKKLFASDKKWEQAYKKLSGDLKRLDACKGKLGKQAKRCLDLVFGLRKQLSRVNTYARRRHDVDTRISRFAGYKAMCDKLNSKFGAATAFVEPELLGLPAATLKALIGDKKLKDYDHYLRQLLRRKAHVLSPKEEALLAKMSLLQRAGYNIYSTFAAAEIKFPKVKVEGGKWVRLSQALFTRYRRSPNRAVRKRVFDAFFGTYKRYRRTIAGMLAAQINANITYAKARRYKSGLAAALDRDNVPTKVYFKMIKEVNRGLPLLHRYLKLRAKLLGIKKLGYHDMYPSIIKKVELSFPYDKSRKIIAKALAPLGTEYVAALKKGLDPKNGWIDVYPNKGKRSGAYMDGDAYDVHPYVLCNHLDNYGSLTTLAHEMGHAVHSYLTVKNQPFSKSEYATFVAEVASTVDEALLMEHMLAKEKDPMRRLFLLGQRMESFRTTLFRQALFAEFELEIYRAAEKNKPLTADLLTKIYAKLVRRYYGHKKGLVTVNDLHTLEWAYIPHFYYNFYVFQYATGITAATALSESIRKNGPKARDRYIRNMLKAGASDYPIDLLARAGVDLRSTKPYRAALSVFKRTIIEAEKLVAKLQKP